MKWALLFSVLFSSVAFAQRYSGPIAEAMGGAGRASVDPAECTHMNPACLSHLEKYYFAPFYGTGTHPAIGNDQQMGLALVDGSPSNLFAGSLSYNYRKQENLASTMITSHDIQIAAGAFALPGLSLGLGVHRLMQNVSTGGDYTQHNIHLGALYSPLEFLGLSFVAYEALGSDSSVPQSLQLIPSFAIGVQGVYEERFRVRLDIARPDKANPGQRSDVMVGIETALRKEVAFRVGHQWKETQNQALFTAGLGFMGPRLSMDYSFQKDTRVSGGIRHLIDLWIPL